MKKVAFEICSEVDQAAAGFMQLTDADALHERGPGKWVKKEILGHLIDSAVNNLQRFIRAQSANPFIWPGYNQEEWVKLQQYRERPWLELVKLWSGLNHHIASVIENVPAGKLATSCVIGDREPASLEWWMLDYLRHLRHHLDQLARP
jgi:hypothetical protein